MIFTVYIKLHCSWGRVGGDRIIDGTVAGPEKSGSEFQFLHRKKSPLKTPQIFSKFVNSPLCLGITRIIGKLSLRKDGDFMD